VKKKEITDERAKKVIKAFQNLNITSLTPVDAMKKLIEIKEKLED
jgi:DNA mismatch repair ATPase MutS